LNDLLNRRKKDYAYPQHGDFSPLNIIIAKNKKEVGIIDWGDFGVGYPPLFDFFSLFPPTYNFFNQDIKRELASLAEKYFEVNLVSKYIHTKIMTYCQHLKIDAEFIPLYFLEFLLLKFNRFNFNHDTYFATLYQKYIEYYLENFDGFIFSLKAKQNVI
jgi:hypothetical protein